MGTPSDTGSGSYYGPEGGRHARQDSAAGAASDAPHSPETPPVAEEPPFDPYRFGRPDHPIPPEFAPPGYVPDPPPPKAGPTPYPGPPPGAGQGTYSPPSAPYPYGQAPYGQAPYGQAPYGQAPYGPPAPHGYSPANASNGKAVAAMVLGIAAILLCWLSILDAALIIPAIIFGFLGLGQARRRGGAGKGMAVTGLVCAAVATVLAVIVTVLVTNAIDKCGGTANQNEPGFRQCVQDHIV